MKQPAPPLSKQARKAQILAQLDDNGRRTPSTAESGGHGAPPKPVIPGSKVFLL